MKTRFLFGILFLFISIGLFGFLANGKKHREKIFVAEKTDSTNEIKSGVWVYFSSSYFPGDNILADGQTQDLTHPWVEKKLSKKQIVLLDSVLNGLKEPPPTNDKRASMGCFSPRHAVVYFDSTGGVVKYINICFACNATQYYPDYFGKASLDAWELFFKRIGFPARTNYDTFFNKAKTDSLYRKKTGIFHF